MTFKEELLPQIEKGLNKIMVIVHGDAVDLAPRGYHVSNSLRSSIFATRSIRRGKTIQASLIAKAPYAKFQHDTRLRHASPSSGPAFKSFADFGQSSDEKESYNEGYNLLKDTSERYKSKFLERAIFDNEDLIAKL